MNPDELKDILKGRILAKSTYPYDWTVNINDLIGKTIVNIGSDSQGVKDLIFQTSNTEFYRMYHSQD